MSVMSVMSVLSVFYPTYAGAREGGPLRTCARVGGVPRITHGKRGAKTDKTDKSDIPSEVSYLGLPSKSCGYSACSAASTCCLKDFSTF